MFSSHLQAQGGRWGETVLLWLGNCKQATLKKSDLIRFSPDFCQHDNAKHIIPTHKWRIPITEGSYSIKKECFWEHNMNFWDVKSLFLDADVSVLWNLILAAITSFSALCFKNDERFVIQYQVSIHSAIWINIWYFHDYQI